MEKGADSYKSNDKPNSEVQTIPYHHRLQVGNGASRPAGSITKIHRGRASSTGKNNKLWISAGFEIQGKSEDGSIGSGRSKRCRVDLLGTEFADIQAYSAKLRAHDSSCYTRNTSYSM